ncbi:hypothetical protein LIER_06313 [Lithospermum erythrorhizon]|uniref:Uncharacterized protein n=1 Tax=Lithospermum erythrorhizon TaxID=34254 RepID=A0AAV3P8F9_LITER
MTGPRVPLFCRAKVVKRVSKEPRGSPAIVAQPATAHQSSSMLGKRPASAETRPPLFSMRQKSIAHKLPRSEILDLTEDPHLTTLYGQEASKESSNHNPSTIPDEGADSAPKAKTWYSTNFLDLPYTLPGGFQVTEDSNLWKKSDAFGASRPLLLERIRKDYDSINDPLEVHGVVARHLIRAMNTSYAISCRADLLDDAREEACEKESAAELRVKE